MKAAHIFLLIAACYISEQAFAAEKLSVLELLDKYAENQDRRSSFIVKTETMSSTKWADRDAPSFMREILEARVDGERVHIHTQTWYRLPSKDAPTPIENAKIFYHLWDGEIYMTYRVGLRVDMNSDEESIKYTVASIGLPSFAIRYSEDEPLEIVLRQAKTVSVRDKLERVGFEDCYVIDAKTSSGTYTVWIDPQYDYQIAQAEIRVGPGEHFRFRTLDDNESRFLSIRNIRYENNEGIWIPMEADIHEEGIEPEPDQNVTIDSHHKITQITLNPDHEALGSFVPDIENGTTVIDRDSGVRYTWREGMKFVVDEWDGRIRYVPEDWSILVDAGKALPEFESIDLDITAEDTKDKAILLCFFDMNQRPSQNCIQQLNKKAQELKTKDVVVFAVQTSKVDKDKLSDWVKKNHIPFTIGMILDEQEKARFAWGVRSLPWLILTDKEHMVISEGIMCAELEVEKLSAGKLLDRYAENQNKMKSLIARTESVWIPSAESTTEQQLKQNRSKSIVEFRYEDTGKDFKAYFCRTPLKLESDGTWVEKNASRSTKLLWRDKRYYQYYKGPRLAVSKLYLTADAKYAGKELSGIAYDGVGPFRGVLCGDIERIDSILRQSDALSVQPDLDQVGSVKCYVVDAVSRHGTYTIWFDPEHGYGIAKAIVCKGPEDLRWGRPRSSSTYSFDNSTEVMQNVRFKCVNGIWFPMEFEWLSTEEYEDRTQSGRLQYKVTYLDVNPDHNDLGSFSLDGLGIQNGTRIRIGDAPGKPLRTEYTWQKGKKFVVDEWDGRIRYVPEDWSILVGAGKPLPEFEEIDLDITAEDIRGKAILLCFFNMNQRPSRNCMLQLNKRAKELMAKDVVEVAVQASKIDQDKLNDWIKKNKIPFPVGMVQGDQEKTRFTWGARSLPWLILTDKKHIVRAEGFSISELGNKYKLASIH